MGDDTERIVYDEWKEVIEKEFTQAETQAELRKGVIEGSTQYHDLVKSQEENPDIVDRRMLTESPILTEQKLRFNGNSVLPDWDAHDKARRKKKWLPPSKKE